MPTELRLLLAAALFLVAETAPAPIIVGNGSDPRTMPWTNGRIAAVNQLHKVESYPRVLTQIAEMPADVRRFLQGDGVLAALKRDVFNARHLYDTDRNPDVPELCALTNVPPAPDGIPASLDDVRIHLPACEPHLRQGGARFAVRTLIHESTHHLLRDPALRERFGIVFSTDPVIAYQEEERFADETAYAIERAFDRVAAIGVHHWRDVSLEHDGLEERGMHTAVWTGAAMIVWGGCKESRRSVYGCGEYFASGGIYDPEADRVGGEAWRRVDESAAPEARAWHTAVWTGDDPTLPRRMIVWGGCTKNDGCERYLNDGGIYDPAADRWEPMTKPAARDVTPRIHHGMAWTGREVLIWGGSTGVNTPGAVGRALRDGAAYDPASDTWRALPPPPDGMLEARSQMTALWTGATGNPATARKLLVWGGCDFEFFNDTCRAYYNDGALFDPETNEWTPLVTTGTPPSARRLHASVHVTDPDESGAARNLLLVWGGERDGRFLGDGAFLDLATLRWQRINSLGPGPRARHSAVWTPAGMLVFGGLEARERYATRLSLYRLPTGDEPSGRWYDLATEYYPLIAQNHAALWTGDAMIVWGGQTDRSAFQSIGAVFRLGTLY